MALTTAVMQRAKIEREEEEDDPEVYIGGNIRRRMAEAARKNQR